MTTKNSDIVARYLGLSSDTISGDNAGKNGLYTGTIACATTDLEAADIVTLIPVKSSDSLKSIVLFGDDLDGATGLTYHIGIYKVIEVAGVKTLTATGGDVDVYAASATDLRAANKVGIEYAFHTKDINKINNEVWQDVGLSADDGSEYVLALTVAVVAATPAAGDISYKIQVA